MKKAASNMVPVSFKAVEWLLKPTGAVSLPECLAATSSLKTYLRDLSREGVTTLERLAVKLHRACCRRVAAIDFLLNAQYVLIIDNLTGKVEGEEAWKTLKAPLQASS